MKHKKLFSTAVAGLIITGILSMPAAAADVANTNTKAKKTEAAELKRNYNVPKAEKAQKMTPKKGMEKKAEKKVEKKKEVKSEAAGKHNYNQPKKDAKAAKKAMKKKAAAKAEPKKEEAKKEEKKKWYQR